MIALRLGSMTALQSRWWVDRKLLSQRNDTYMRHRGQSRVYAAPACTVCMVWELATYNVVIDNAWVRAAQYEQRSGMACRVTSSSPGAEQLVPSQVSRQSHVAVPQVHDASAGVSLSATQSGDLWRGMIEIVFCEMLCWAVLYGALCVHHSMVWLCSGERLDT